MQESYRRKIGLGDDGNSLIHLIVLNAVLFATLLFIFTIYKLGSSPNYIENYYKDIFNWFVLSADKMKLGSRPWTILTYMFCDDKIFRFIANMIWLWGFGYILQELTGTRHIIPIYLYGGFAGAFLFLSFFMIFPHFEPAGNDAFLVGSTPPVMAVAIATTTIAPNYRIFPLINGGIPLWVLTLAFVLINVAGISHGNAGIYVAEIGAAGVGYIFISLVRKGRDPGLWINQFFDWVSGLFDPANKFEKDKNPRERFYYNVSGTQPYRKIPNITQKRIDEILDKINQQGFRLLTEEEKEILKRAADKEDL